MNDNLSDVRQAWAQATDRMLTLAVVVQLNEYEPAIQEIILDEFHQRDWSRQMPSRNQDGSATRLNEDGTLAGYICLNCQTPFINNGTGLCKSCNQPVQIVGYCRQCDTFWSRAPGQYCPAHHTILEQGKVAGVASRFWNFTLDLVFFIGGLFPLFYVAQDINWFGSFHKLIFLLYYLIYFTGFEWFLQRTPAKFITSTKVVNQEGAKPDFLSVFVRSLTRIPGLLFMFIRPGIGIEGYHDRWSETYVVKS